MRTTLDLPQDLLLAARKELGARTRTETIIMALKQVLRRRRLRRIVSSAGRIRIDPAVLRERDAR